MIVALPLSEVSRFGELFRYLETCSEELRIASFGVTLTTLEEVFLKLAAQEKSGDEPPNGEHDHVEVQWEDSKVFAFF
jgi:ATP-binding cassette, subfamily A (ABC1), member 3